MSFSTDLWSGFDFIYNHFNERIKGLKQLLYMLNEKFIFENDAASRLKRVYDLNYPITTEGSLATAIAGFKTDMLKQYSCQVEYSKNIKEDIIEPLKSFLEYQMTAGKKYYIEIKELEKEFKYVFDTLEKNKLKFHSLAKAAEEANLHSEIGKNNPNLSADQKNKLAARAQQSLKDAKEVEKVYIEYINTANSYRDNYIEGTKRILDEFQIMDGKYIEITKECLRKYLDHQFTFLASMAENYEKRVKVTEDVSIKGDIKDFIERNSTNSVPPFKFEYIPYTSDSQIKACDQTPYPAEIVNNVKIFISKAFCSELPEVEQDPQELKINNEIQTILNSAWEGRIGTQEKTTIERYIKEKKYRKYFLQCVNRFRVSGLFTIDEKSFTALGDLLNKILDEAQKEKDYESIKFVMILSQTFYHAGEDINNPRVFLQTAIESHEAWKQIEIWEGIIKYSVSEEIHNHRSYTAYSSESQEEKLLRIQSIAFGQLLSFTFNMLSFEIPKEKVRETIHCFCKIYKIPEEMALQILKSVDEYSTTMDQQVKMDIVDDNLSYIAEDISDKNLEVLQTMIDNNTITGRSSNDSPEAINETDASLQTQSNLNI